MRIRRSRLHLWMRSVDVEPPFALTLECLAALRTGAWLRLGRLAALDNWTFASIRVAVVRTIARDAIITTVVHISAATGAADAFKHHVSIFTHYGCTADAPASQNASITIAQIATRQASSIARSVVSQRVIAHLPWRVRRPPCRLRGQNRRQITRHSAA